MTAEQAAAWLKNLDDVIKAGGKSVSAIAEFLESNHDTLFTPEEYQLLGYDSAREAVLEALARIGGPEAIAVMARELEATASPREVALLALGLNAAAPGQHHGQAVSAARESLALAAREPVAGMDVAPLFEVLQAFGGIEAIDDLERAATRWGHYATFALGAVSEGGGVPALLRIAEISPGRPPHPARLQALQVIAQLASSNDGARASLIALARENQITSHVWPYLARPLAGEQARLQNPLLDSRSDVTDRSHTGSVHITSGNQNLLWMRPGESLSPAESDRLIALVSELASVTNDPDGQRVLKQTMRLITQQSAQASAVPLPAR
jgi:hypothetical protein